MTKILAKSLIAILLLLISCGNGYSQNKKLSETMKTIVSNIDFKHSSVSMSVYNISKNKFEYNYDSERLLIPSSILKLVTTAVGFEQLGKDFRFKTLLGYTGIITEDGILNGDVIIVGGGDPLFGSYRYRQTSMDTIFKYWFEALKKEGIKSINGKVSYDASIFSDKQLHDSWAWGDVGNYYGCGALGLNFHENMYFAYFNAGRREKYPAILDRVTPKGIEVRAQNDVTTAPANTGDNVVIYGVPSAAMRYYSGTVPLGEKDFTIRGTMPSPSKNCAEQFSNYLRNNGINVTFHASSEKYDDSKTTIVFNYYSVPYYLVSQYTNMMSNNLYAECIFKYIGYKLTGQGSFESGAKAVYKYIQDHNLDATSLNIVDGSGLSRSNNITTRFLTEFLANTSKTNYFSAFKQTIPRAGKDGTVKSLLKNLPKGAEVHVKSGTMQGIKSYAGYITRVNGEQLSFSIIINNTNASKTEIQQNVEKLMLAIVTQ